MYKLKQTKRDFLKNIDDIEYSDVSFKNDSVIYKSDFLPSENYEIIKNYKVIKSHFFKRKIGFILGFILFVFYISINSLLVKNITFTNVYDYEVETYVESMLDNGVLKNDLITLNHEIRKEFTEYEWININKVGNTIFVDLKVQPSYDKVILNDEEGDFYSSKEGVIKYFQIDKGLPLIEYNQYVKSGQLLVSGDLNYIEEPIEEETDIEIEENLVPPRGIVIAETFTTTEILIKKEETIEYKTGKVYTVYQNKLFDTNYKNNTSKYELFETKTTTIFNFLNIFVRQEVKYYEKDVIIYNNTQDSADEKLEMYINTYFYTTIRHEQEKIVEYNILSSDEDEEYYRYNVLIKSWEDITNFIKR